MSRNNLLLILFFIFLIVFLPDSMWKETRFAPKLRNMSIDCSGIEIPKELKSKKIPQYCECVKNPVDSRSKEEKLELCKTEIYQDKEKIRSIVFKNQ